MKDAAKTQLAPQATSKRRIVLVVFFAGLVVLGLLLNPKELLDQALVWVYGLGMWAPVFFIGIYIAATVLFLPGSVLTLGAGALFGVLWGTVYVSIASVTGATFAFLIGRYFARNWVAAKIGANEKFNAVDNAIGREGWKIVLLTRLSPVFPFNLLNYSLGLTKVTLPHYFFASWIGMIPGTIMYVYLGSLAGELARLGAEGRERSTAEWALYLIGLAATVAVTVYVTKLAKKALNEKV